LHPTFGWRRANLGVYPAGVNQPVTKIDQGVVLSAGDLGQARLAAVLQLALWAQKGLV